MDPILFEQEKKKRRSGDDETGDLFAPPQPKRELAPHVPHQPSSVSSKAAAEKIAPVFRGNQEICFRAIRDTALRGGITRKQIADQHFDGKQNYVTGPVSILIEQDYIYEEPLKINGIIQRRDDGEVIPRRFENSAILLPTPKGQAVVLPQRTPHAEAKSA